MAALKTAKTELSARQFIDREHIYVIDEDGGLTTKRVANIKLTEDIAKKTRPFIYAQNCIIAENKDDVQLFILGDKTHQSYALCGLRDGKEVPGTFKPIEVYGDEKQYVSLC